MQSDTTPHTEVVPIPRPVNPPSCSLIIVDDFYNNPMETRNYMLSQPFTITGNFPGFRTASYATEGLKQIIQEYVYIHGGKIVQFDIPSSPGVSNGDETYNGAFQITTSRDKSWVHNDGNNNWAGILYLTPDAPPSSGTAFYRYCDGTSTKQEMELRGNKSCIDEYSQDMTKWVLVDNIGNVFNRLILFNSQRFHRSVDYFGTTQENGRLFQVFFFSTER